MKYIHFFLFFLPFLISAQPEFSFDLYFEDALGNRDTVTIGYDPEATDGIDTQFGEENIISQPWDSVLDVRIAIGNFPPYGGSIPLFVPSKQTKKQISHPYCESNYYNAYKSVIQIKNAVFPIKLEWYTDQLNSLCTASNFVTDWFPGCWFDCQIIGNEQEPWFFLNSDSLLLNYTSLVNSYNNDTTNLLFVSLSNGIEEISSNFEIVNDFGLKVGPNPVNSNSNLHISKGEKYYLYNVHGNLLENGIIENNALDLKNRPSGVYFLQIENNGTLHTTKLIVL